MKTDINIENFNGIYMKEVPYIEIPENQAQIFLDYLFYYKDENPKYKKESKLEGIRQFNLECEDMFNDEHSELYPESVK